MSKQCSILTNENSNMGINVSLAAYNPDNHIPEFVVDRDNSTHIASVIKYNFTEQQVTIDTNVDEISVIMPIINKSLNFNPSLNINGNNLTFDDQKSSNNVKIIETKSYGNNLTLNSEKNSFKINSLSKDSSFKVNTIKQVKKHLIADKVLLDSNQKIECQAKEIKSLEKDAEVEFLKDNIIRKDNEFPLPTKEMNFGKGQSFDSLPLEIVGRIGFYVNGDIKNCNTSETFTVTLESYDVISITDISGADSSLSSFE